MIDPRTPRAITDDIVVDPDEIDPVQAVGDGAATPSEALEGNTGAPPAPALTPPSKRGADAETADGSARPSSVAGLRRERRDLFDQREEAVYHVGGLAVELRRRGIDDAELVNRRADLVLETDQRIADLDLRLTEMSDRRHHRVPATAGYCLSCGAPFQEEAAFCFRCGARVLPPDEPESDVTGQEMPTTIIDVAEETR
mgnify:CR=1 FL=1